MNRFRLPILCLCLFLTLFGIGIAAETINYGGYVSPTTLSGDVTATQSSVVTIGASAVGTSEVTDGTLVNADVSATAEIGVNKIANGTDGQIPVTQGGNVAWVTPSGAWTLINAGENSIGNGYITPAMIDNSNSDAQVLIGQGGGSPAWMTPTGCALTNAGAYTCSASGLGANSATASKVFYNTLTVTIQTSASNGVVAKTSGAPIMGFYPFANIDDAHFELANRVRDFDSGVEVVLNGVVAGEPVTYKVVVIEP